MLECPQWSIGSQVVFLILAFVLSVIFLNQLARKSTPQDITSIHTHCYYTLLVGLSSLANEKDHSLLPGRSSFLNRYAVGIIILSSHRIKPIPLKEGHYSSDTSILKKQIPAVAIDVITSRFKGLVFMLLLCFLFLSPSLSRSLSRSLFLYLTARCWIFPSFSSIHLLSHVTLA
jgi:hypothetical protein